MKKVWIAADSIVSPLGTTTEENYRNIQKGISGLRLMQPNALSPVPAYLGRIESISQEGSDSKFEALSKKLFSS